MSIDRNTANAKSQAQVNVIQTIGDQEFIANVDAQIQTAIALGKFKITALSNHTVSLTTVFTYYSNLGYAVTFPDYANQNGAQLPSIIQQPANYFGYNWAAYWLNTITLYGIKNPARMTIAWNSYSPPANPEGPV